MGKCVRSVLAALAAASVLAAPGAAAAEAYLNGVFQATVTNAGTDPTTFILPTDQPFPQVTFPDEKVGGDTEISVVSGLEISLLIATGEVMQGAISGTMRFALLYPTSLSPPVVFLVGTFSLGPDIHGVVVGDQYSMYLSGTDDRGTVDTADDQPFLLRANGHYTGSFGVGDQVFGDLQVLLGGPLLRAVGGTVDAPRTAAGVVAAVGAFQNPDPFTFTQIEPPDGTADLPVTVDPADAYSFWTSNAFRGDLGGLPGPAGFFSFNLAALVIDGGPSAGPGLSFGRFEWPAADGTLVQGFMVGDLEAPDGTGIPVEGRMFSTVATRRGSADFFAGTYQGHLNGTPDLLDNAGLAVAGGIYEVDAAPPEVVGFDSPGWQAGVPVVVSTYTRDLNGWRDQKTVQVLLGTSRSKRRLLMRYDAVRERFQLYNRAARRWTARCAPGSPRVLRVAQAQLSCSDSSAQVSGEFLRVDWALTPTAKLVGTWRAYVQVADRARLATGWRMMEGSVEVAP